MDKICYKQAGFNADNYKIPIMFYPSNINKEKQSNALQWLLINYSRSISNVSISMTSYTFESPDAFIIVPIK